MAIIALRAWYIKQYEPLKQVLEKPCDLRLNRNSLLKTGMRADFLDERIVVQATKWFAAYLEGSAVEFYIEGSGYYIISNIDLLSQEIYFTKQQSLSGLEPIIYFSPQTEYAEVKDSILDTLNNTVAAFNERSRIPLKLEISPRPQDTPLRLSNSQFKKISKSLLYIADTTPIASISGENNQKLLLSSNVCVEIGYALETKDIGQILLLRSESKNLTGDLPFDVSGYKELIFKQDRDLQVNLPKLMKTLLQRFTLFV
ncbi:conserved hypothetical protein [Hyella patelloides LEGE 07179]|uniref:Uncharacterized protein n=1 Tax=Hyella patelloides LEGE 07179 TaxID=945734 RepID=A0A563VP47_9CYAN|nr:hypothetical protein [Hyella patelloides]VEP13055.1 conserved hypothetical protein [Hyella patelloides LEGE 07179]